VMLIVVLEKVTSSRPSLPAMSADSRSSTVGH
jgi:hypothetical protein